MKGEWKTERLFWEVGRTPSIPLRERLMERLALADAPNMRPRRMLIHPMMKRTKEETRVKSSTK